MDLTKREMQILKDSLVNRIDVLKGISHSEDNQLIKHMINGLIGECLDLKEKLFKEEN